MKKIALMSAILAVSFSSMVFADDRPPVPQDQYPTGEHHKGDKKRRAKRRRRSTRAIKRRVMMKNITTSTKTSTVKNRRCRKITVKKTGGLATRFAICFSVTSSANHPG